MSYDQLTIKTTHFIFEDLGMALVPSTTGGYVSTAYRLVRLYHCCTIVSDGIMPHEHR
jgi:hypothetical protein